MTEHLTERQQEIRTPERDYDAEIADAEKVREALRPLYDKATYNTDLWHFLAQAMDDISDMIGALQIAKDKRS